MQECKSSEHMCEKVLATKALCTAGLVQSVQHLEGLITDSSEQYVLRILVSKKC